MISKHIVKPSFSVDIRRERIREGFTSEAKNRHEISNAVNTAHFHKNSAVSVVQNVSNTNKGKKHFPNLPAEDSLCGRSTLLEGHMHSVKAPRRNWVSK